MSPNCSCASESFVVGATEPVPSSATGFTASLLSVGGGVAGGVGGATSFCFVSSEPTCSCFLYFLKMLSL